MILKYDISVDMFPHKYKDTELKWCATTIPCIVSH